MSDFYDRNGNPITMDEWVATWKNTDRRVALDKLPNGYTVSTVYLGLDHGWGEGDPLIFESMVFGPDSEGDECDMLRYATEEQARAGHKSLVLIWEAK